MALRVPSVPELVKRTWSREGTRSQSSLARRTWDSEGAPKLKPLSLWSLTALTTSGLAWPAMKVVALSMKSR